MKTIFGFIAFIFIAVSAYSQETVDISVLEIKDRVYYHNGKEFNGKSYAKHENGKIGMKGSFEDGRKEGLWIWWYSDGQKKRETTYKNNKKEGLTIYWHRNGVKSKEITYKANKNIEQKLWDEQGNRLPNPSFQSFR